MRRLLFIALSVFAAVANAAPALAIGWDLAGVNHNEMFPREQD
ncbi:MAG TPA: hypothetical protein VGL99_15315 [Chloroflexota bacterium]|jgi:hypothetical protein